MSLEPTRENAAGGSSFQVLVFSGRVFQLWSVLFMASIPLSFVRELQFEINGERRTGKLTIRELSFSPAKQKWECHWSLDHLYPDAVSFTGDDALDALIRTLDFAASLIRSSNADGYKVFWQYDGDNAGLLFPLWKPIEGGAV
jgi:hypothetical protein